MPLTRPKYSQIYDTDYKQSVRVATTGDVGNLLATGNMTNSVDGVTVVLNDRILVKNQTATAQNGIYSVLAAGTGVNGTWVRSLDADANDKVTSGLTTVVTAGSTNIAITFKLTTADPITLGTTGLVFVNSNVGVTGNTGTAATIAVGTTTTGLPGSSATVTNSGTSAAATFNFTIPRGDVGTTGTAATIAVGTTTTGLPGSSATVTNSGTSAAATFNFTIPRGDVGATGPTGPKAVSIGNPSSSENVTLFYTSTAMTLTAARAVLVGSTSPSITYSLLSGADRSVTTTTHISAATVTSTTTGNAATIGTASIPLGVWVWLQTSAQAGTVTNFALDLAF